MIGRYIITLYIYICSIVMYSFSSNNHPTRDPLTKKTQKRRVRTSKHGLQLNNFWASLTGGPSLCDLKLVRFFTVNDMELKIENNEAEKAEEKHNIVENNEKTRVIACSHLRSYIGVCSMPVCNQIDLTTSSNYQQLARLSHDLISLWN